jgi:hypothetical protein
MSIYWICIIQLPQFLSKCIRVFFFFAEIYIEDRNTYQNSVHIYAALSYGLDDRGCRFRFRVGAGNFSLRHCVHFGSEAYPASYPMGTGALSLGVKRPGHEANNSPPASAEVK